jgi:outer membrane protein OmpA-like peptidoglycan-associated protein/osmotically-inducible protein OsmY
VTLDGLMLDVAGVARSADDYDGLLARLAATLPPGVTVVSTDVMPASVAPYGWQGAIDNGAVTLTGYVPSLERRNELSQLARGRFAGMTIDDRMRVALGEPRMDWVGAVKFAMEQLALLTRGSVAITENGLTITGEARDPAAFATIADLSGRTLPAGLVLKTTTVTPPTLSPYRFVVERRDGGIVLAGYAARAEDRQALVAAARRLAGPSDVTDELVYASGAPAGFMEAATAAVGALGRLIGGRVTLADQTVEFAGTAIHEAALGETVEALRAGLPGSYSIIDLELRVAQIAQPVTPTECRDLLQGVLKSGRIEFEGTGAVLTRDSLGVLDRVAGVVQRCPEAEVEVGAHSDSDGTAASNRDRTQARAEAIVDQLVSAGVIRERLAAVGYGESKPLADNSTNAGKAANRRIEFSVTAPSG